MSFPALAWASKFRADSAAMKLVLLGYADRHNEETGCAYPSIAWLAEFGSLNRKTVIAAVEKLERAGILSDTGERKGDTKQIKVYRLHIETVPKTEQSQKRNSTEKVVKQSQKRDTDTVRTRLPSEGKPSSGKRAKVAAHPLPANWEPIDFGATSACRGIVDGWPPGEFDYQLEHFRAHHMKKADRFSSWQDAWKTWVLNSRNFGNGKRGFQQDSGEGIGRTRAAAIEVFGSPDDPAYQATRGYA